MRWLPFILISTLLCGCVQFTPHSEQTSPQVVGRVLDARTHEPIKSARVCLTWHTRTSCKTDAAGQFRLKATHSFVWVDVGSTPGGGGQEWPVPQRWPIGVTVSHPDYVTYIEDILHDDQASKGDIFLEPKHK